MSFKVRMLLRFNLSIVPATQSLLTHVKPDESLWSQMKAQIKRMLRERLAAFMGPPPEPGMTREEFRMQYLEFVAQGVIDGIDVHRLHHYTLRLEYFYGLAERMDDMQVGM
ncbi:hypothetical protein AeMF1_005247 [Aphanomyces euteiches]|nr:hypothetical protein AeMF1_005247 [Aphanomyces euteiches]